MLNIKLNFSSVHSQTKVAHDNDIWGKTCKKWASVEKGAFYLLSTH